MERFQSKKLNHEKVLRDPAHNYIHAKDKAILDTINSKEFRRLRRIKQLGSASYAFQGATHTRSKHNLGAYELTCRVCDIFEEKYTSEKPGDGLWDPNERSLVECAALLHDTGRGPYSHTFEYFFGTNYEKMGQQIITNKSTEINRALGQISPNFPELVVNVIVRTYSNPRVVKLISSQADADRMDYLLRDAYFTEVIYGSFDLTRILEVIRPYHDGICFTDKDIYTVGDYIASCYQMYQQVHFHRVDRSTEVILHHLLERARIMYEVDKLQVIPQLEVFLEGNWTLEDYLSLDDGIMETNFLSWANSSDQILSDLLSRYLYRHPLESVKINEDIKSLLSKLKNLIKQADFNPSYYTAANSAFDEPYDAYEPIGKNVHSPIETMRANGSLVELSELDPLAKPLNGTLQRNKRFFFPKVMAKETDESQIFDPVYQEFQKYTRDNTLRYLRCSNKKR